MWRIPEAVPELSFTASFFEKIIYSRHFYIIFYIKYEGVGQVLREDCGSVSDDEISALEVPEILS